MHIGIHCFEYPPCNHGGIGSFTKDLAEGLVREGHEVTVFGFYYKNVLDLDETVVETINGVTVYRYPNYKKFSNERLNIVFSRIQLYRNVKALHQEKAFDLIESPESTGWFPFGVPNDIPFVTRLHGGVAYLDSELKRNRSRLAKIMEKYQLKKSDKIVSVSDYAGRKTLQLYGIEYKGYEVIYNSVRFIDQSYCKETAVEKGLIVFAGSIMKMKGVENLMRAMNIVFEKNQYSTLKLAGKNMMYKNGQPYQEYLMSLVNKEYHKRIKFLGHLHRDKNLYQLLCSAEVCCYPSYVETFAMAPLEAMALGKAVVFTNTTSGPEAIEDNVSGMLCDPRKPEDIAEKILLLLTHKELREKVGKNGKKRIKILFNYDKWIESNINLYRNSIHLKER